MNLSVKDAARLLNVSEKTIYRWIKQEVVPAYRVHEQYRFNRVELLEWATSRRMGVTAELLDEPGSDAAPLTLLSDALEAGGIFYRVEGDSREQVLTEVAQHLRLPDEVDRGHLQQVLIARERIASTAIGNGIAIPHPRNPALLHLTKSTVTLCFLEQPVDFKALDGQPVRLLLTVIAPTLRSHLHLLSQLGFVLKNPYFKKILSEEGSREEILAALRQAEAELEASRP
ncbi:PTS sugar transporter subunit IIA [Trichloromonas sp.]|uniref:PTS sugar transporter subunit IIA n=1 Tax=Trichloromonas sp. TaxID=3069249 RepID=UPI002A3C40F7|nr:PTS sugar transporter subunit IIA [Trichloromonas sp.]